jgi:hypothetical protein
VSNQETDAREIAFLVAKGLTPAVAAQKTDLPQTYVDQLTETDTFVKTLEEVGGDVAMKAWKEYKLERQTQDSLRTKVRGRIPDYFKILDDIAMDGRVKPEVRKDIIFRLMDQAGINKDSVEGVQTIELPPSFFTALAHANEEMERWKSKKL